LSNFEVIEGELFVGEEWEDGIEGWVDGDGLVDEVVSI